MRCFPVLLPNYIHVYTIIMEKKVISGQEGILLTSNTPLSSCSVGSKAISIAIKSLISLTRDESTYELKLVSS